MPLLALAGPIASAAGLGTAASSAIGIGGTLLGGALSGNQANRAAGQAGQAAQVDINQLNEQVRSIARQNALDSAELERQLTPEVPQLRTAANQAVLAGLAPSASDQASQSLLLSGLGNNINSPLLAAAIARAKANLALGGSLSTETQNAVTQSGLAHAGMVGGGRLGLGRDIVARDLGLTSLQLQQQRLNDASQFGQLDTQNQQFNAQNLLQKIQLLKSLSESNFNRAMGAAQYGEGIQRPVVGLDPGSIANIAVGNQNARGAAFANQANIYGRQSQNMYGLAGSMFQNAGGMAGLAGAFGGGNGNIIPDNSKLVNTRFGGYYPTG